MFDKLNKIAFIGAGSMAQAIIDGLIKNGLAPKSIFASARSDETRQTVAKRFGIATGTNSEACEGADVIVLAVKPQQLETVCTELRPYIPKDSLLISVAAGINCESLEAWLGPIALVRCMPNTPSAIGMGASGLYANTYTTETQKTLAQSILAAVGVARFVQKETLIDTVTAVAGSAPAYFFLFIEAMIDSAKKMGLTEEDASLLAKQTALGAASLAMQSDLSVKELRKKVTSPNGTTERAINTFEQHALRELVDHAMQACANRAAELSEDLGVK